MILKYLIIFLSLFTLLLADESYQVVEEFGDSAKVDTQKELKSIEIKKIEKETKKVIKNLKSNKKIEHKRVLKRVLLKKRDFNKSKKDVVKVKNSINKIAEKKYKSSRAKLVIIIDDISHSYQLNMIKKLGLHITPSIFPPSKMNMKSYLLARGLKHYMVHLPLQSGSKQMNKMHKTIFINYTNKQIERRVKEIRKLFPSAKYINNHTGSVFTSNYRASKELYKVLLDNGFKFVDSRTTDRTKIPKIAKEFGRRYLKADLFIDNKLNFKSIEKELNQAIALAKRRGYAVVIGHPHIQTFKALESLKHKLKSLNLIYIDQL